MKAFEYGDEEISKKEILFSIPSMMLGIGIITLPRVVAEKTLFSDGWISVVLAGVIAAFFAWVCAKLASRFPKQSYFDYVPRIVTKPGAWIVAIITGVYFMMITSHVIRGISGVSRRYLFDRTPIEAIALAFFVVVIYAVSGSRAALLRLNLMFFPIVLGVACLVQILNIGVFELDNLKPFFVTPWVGIMQGTLESLFSFLGFSVTLFYASMMNRPEQAPKAVVQAMAIPLVLYLFIYISAISVFSHNATVQIIYPTVELAKEAQVPGRFFERLESLFFTIWIMTIFNTVCMSYDVLIMVFKFFFPKMKKLHWLFVLSPLIYFLSMTPKDMNQYYRFGEFVSYLGIAAEMLLPALVLIIAAIRGVRGNEQTKSG